MDPATVIALCKENIQPLRYGRNATQLGTALRAQEDADAQQVLLQEKQMYEDAIKNDESNDPLENWYEYILWVEQSYPKSGHESPVARLLQQCLATFEKDVKYHQDRRYIRLWINYISMQKNPLELYQLLHSNGIGTMVADMYRAWAFELEQADDYKKADEVYLMGLSALAEPRDELEYAHKNFQLAVARKTLGRIDDRSEVSLLEQRQAFSSLRAIKAGKKVGSIRTGHRMREHYPGTISQMATGAHGTKSNSKIHVYQDDVSGGVGKAASILDHVPIEDTVHKENTIKAGPWSSGNKKGPLVTSTIKSTFKVHEDTSEEFSMDKVRLFPNHREHFDGSKYQEHTMIPVYVADPPNRNILLKTHYPKDLVYADNVDRSMEEIRADLYIKRHGCAKNNREMQEISLKDIAPDREGHDAASQELRRYNQEYIQQTETQNKFEDRGSPDRLKMDARAELEQEEFHRQQFTVENQDLDDGTLRMAHRATLANVRASKNKQLNLERQRDSDLEQQQKSEQQQQGFERLAEAERIEAERIEAERIEAERMEAQRMEAEFNAQQQKLRSSDYMHAHTSSVTNEPEEHLLGQSITVNTKEAMSVVQDLWQSPDALSTNPRFRSPIASRMLDSRTKLSFDIHMDGSMTQQHAMSTSKHHPDFNVHSYDDQENHQNYSIVYPGQESQNSYRGHGMQSSYHFQVQPQPQQVQPLHPQHHQHLMQSHPQTHVPSHHQPFPQVPHIPPHPQLAHHQQQPHVQPQQQAHSQHQYHQQHAQVQHHQVHGYHQHHSGHNTIRHHSMEGQPQQHSMQQSHHPTHSRLEHQSTHSQTNTPPLHHHHHHHHQIHSPSINLHRPHDQSQHHQSHHSQHIEHQHQHHQQQQHHHHHHQHHQQQQQQQQQQQPQQQQQEHVQHLQHPIYGNVIANDVSYEQQYPPTLNISLTRQNAESEKTLQFSPYCEPDVEQNKPYRMPPELPYIKSPGMNRRDLKYLENAENKENAIAVGYNGPTDENMIKQQQSEENNLYVDESLGITPLSGTNDTCFTEAFNTQLASSTPMTNHFKQSYKGRDVLQFGAQNAIPAMQPPNSDVPNGDVDDKLSVILESTREYISSSSGSSSVHTRTTGLGFTLTKEDLMPIKERSIDYDEESNESLIHANQVYEQKYRHQVQAVHAQSPRTVQRNVDQITSEIKNNCDLRKSINFQLNGIGDRNDEKVDSMEFEEQEPMEQVVEEETFQLPSGDINPFDKNLISGLLRQMKFPRDNHANGYVKLDSILNKLVPSTMITLGTEAYDVDKCLGKGMYGTVFKAIDLQSGQPVALKMQKPAWVWEYYITREIKARLTNPHMLRGFMDVSRAYIADNASVLVSEYSKYGTLLAVTNQIKIASGKPLAEGLAIFFTIEMLQIVEYLHKCQIIHGDIKPDNFLLMRLPTEDVRPTIQLIDFGCSIDMTLLPEKTTFKQIIKTEDFTCIEMQTGRRWTYQTDLYCLAATSHCLLFGNYMRVSNVGGRWFISSKLPRYAKKAAWEQFFTELLNIESCDNMPDLCKLRNMMEETLAQISEAKSQIRTFVNVLNKR